MTQKVHRISSQELPFPQKRSENMAHNVINQAMNPQPTKHTIHPDAAHLVDNHEPPLGGLLPDADATSIDLPSRFAYYPFKSLYIKPFRVSHVAKLNKSDQEANYLPLLEAVESVLSTVEGIKNPACYLSIPDFYYLLYWLRLNSFPKNDRIVHTSICPNEEHLKKVKSGEWPVDTLEVKVRITESDLTTHYLDQIPDPKIYKLNTPGWYLRPPTMFDFIQFMSNETWMNDSEIHYLAMLAMMVGYDDGNIAESGDKPFGEKIEFVKTLDLGEDDLIRDFENLVSGFGIQEKVVVHCNRCGASWEDYISVDALSFLPQNR